MFWGEIIGILSIIIPGMWISAKIRTDKPLELISFSIIFSLVSWGSIAYFLSFFVTIQPIMLVLWTSFFGILLLKERSVSIKNFQKINFSFSLPKVATIFFLGIFFTAGIVTNITHAPLLYDSVSYHQPFIESFRENGFFLSFENPTNITESRFGGFSKLYEAIWGSIAQIAPITASVLPSIIIFTIIIITMAFAEREKKSNYFTPLLVVGSIIIIAQMVSDYSDGFLTLLIISSIYLLTDPRNHNGLLFFSGLLLGAGISTKITGILYLLAIIVVLGLKPIKNIKKLIFLGGGCFLGFLPLMVQWIIHQPSLISIGFVSENNSTFDFLSLAISGAHSIFAMSISFLLRGDFYLLAIFSTVSLIVIHSFKKEKVKHPLYLLAIATIIPIGFFFIMALKSGTLGNSVPRYTLPIILTGAIIIGDFIKNHLKIKKKYPLELAAIIFIGIIVVIPSTISIIHYSESRDEKNTLIDRTLENLNAISPDGNIFFGNAPNPIVNGFRHHKILDYSYFDPHIEIPCSDLASEKITHVVIFFPEKKRNFGEMNERIRVDAVNEQCGELISSIPGWLNVYRLN